MTTHSSVHGWRILWTEEPGRLQSKVLKRVRHNWSDLATAADGTRCHDLSFLRLSFKPAFSLSSFTLIKRFFCSSSLSAIRVVSSAYLRLIFLLAILIPAHDSSCLSFHMTYTECKLNKQGNNIQPCCTSFPILNQSFVYVWFQLLLLYQEAY